MPYKCRSFGSARTPIPWGLPADQIGRHGRLADPVASRAYGAYPLMFIVVCRELSM